jgi:hypothetical protein
LAAVSTTAQAPGTFFAALGTGNMWQAIELWPPR